MKETRIEPIYCPISKREIKVDDCFMISFFVEEIAPKTVLPEYVDPEEARQKEEECMKCRWHPY